MNQLELSPETRAALDRIRHSNKVLSIFEMPADLAEAAVWEIGKIVLEDRGLPLVQQNGYRWYLRELSKLLRTRTDWDLALELEICLRKWAAYRLDPELLQTLLCECCERIAAMSPEEIEEDGDSTTKAQRHQGSSGETRNQKPETRMQNCGDGSGSTTKTQRHEGGSGETRSQKPETRMQSCGPTEGAGNG